MGTAYMENAESMQSRVADQQRLLKQVGVDLSKRDAGALHRAAKMGEGLPDFVAQQMEGEGVVPMGSRPAGDLSEEGKQRRWKRE